MQFGREVNQGNKGLLRARAAGHAGLIGHRLVAASAVRESQQDLFLIFVSLVTLL